MEKQNIRSLEEFLAKLSAGRPHTTPAAMQDYALSAAFVEHAVSSIAAGDVDGYVTQLVLALEAAQLATIRHNLRRLAPVYGDAEIAHRAARVAELLELLAHDVGVQARVVLKRREPVLDWDSTNSAGIVQRSTGVGP